MKTYRRIAAGLIAGAALALAVVPAVAASIDVNVVLPGAVVYSPSMPRPAYIDPRYEADWRERQLRAQAWRDSPHNHGQVVSAAAHQRNDARKANKHAKKDHGHGNGHGKGKGNGNGNGKHGR